MSSSHHALQSGVSEWRPVPVEVRPHVQTGSQQINSGVRHRTQVAVQVAVDVLACEGHSKVAKSKSVRTLAQQKVHRSNSQRIFLRVVTGEVQLVNAAVCRSSGSKTKRLCVILFQC